MKTLDEVIEAQERCETYPNCHFCYLHSGPMCEWIRDALHYLKEYRSDKAMWEADRKGHLDWIEQYKEAREKHQQAVIELKKNPPLTWDELRAMEGKPVWVEADHAFIQYTGWVLLDKIKEDDPDFTGVKFTCPDRSEFFLLADFIGKTWQAYRKER